MNGMSGTERTQLVERPFVKPFQGLPDGIRLPRVALRLPWASGYNALGVEEWTALERENEMDGRISTAFKGPLTRPLRLGRYTA